LIDWDIVKYGTDIFLSGVSAPETDILFGSGSHVYVAQSNCSFLNTFWVLVKFTTLTLRLPFTGNWEKLGMVYILLKYKPNKRSESGPVES
jgi:hypothetical protein